jgi:hypothetical protein
MLELDKRDELIKAQKELIAKQDELIAVHKQTELILHKIIDNLERELKFYSLVYGSSHQN